MLLNIFLLAILILNRNSLLEDCEETIVLNHTISETISETVSEIKDKELLQIALTFDDGPHPIYTTKILEGLKERNVKATFFVTGENVELYPDIIKAIDEDGHLIGNHTYTHLELREDNKEIFIDELHRTNEIIKDVIGEDTEYVRPPFGRWNEELEKEIMMFPVFWTIDPLDWCTQDVGKVIGRVIGKIKENDIILMHDCYGSTVEATLEIIDILKEQGYEFVTVDKIVLD